MKTIAIVVVILLIVVDYSFGATYTVGYDTSYDFQTITDALAVAILGDTILVAAGTYNASGDYPETFPLQMKDGVTLKWASDGIHPVIDAEQTGSAISCDSLSAEETRIEGFKITGGKSNRGGGLVITSSEFHIVYCEISGNSASRDGGGVYCIMSEPTFVGCQILDNSAGGSGGGLYHKCPLYCWIGVRVKLYNCIITGNSAGSYGGGIFAEGDRWAYELFPAYVDLELFYS